MDKKTGFAEATDDYRFASAIAALGMALRESPYRGQLDLDGVLDIAEKSRGLDEGGYREEFIQLVRKAQGLLNAVAARIQNTNANRP